MPMGPLGAAYASQVLSRALPIDDGIAQHGMVENDEDDDYDDYEDYGDDDDD